MSRRAPRPAVEPVRLAALEESEWELALGALLRLDARSLGVDRVSFWLAVDDPPGLRCELGYIASADGIERGAFLASADAPSYMHALACEAVLAMDDVVRDPRARELRDYCAARHIGAMLDFPLCVRSQLVGVLCHEHVNGHRRWTRRDIELARAAAATVALALEARRRLHAEDGERRARFIAQTSHSLNQTLDEAEVARRAVTLPLPRLADCGALDLFDGDHVWRAAMAHADPKKQPLVDEYLRRFPPTLDGPHVTVLARRLGQAVVVPEVSGALIASYGHSPEQLALLQQLGARSLILLPFANHVVDGVLMLLSASKRYDRESLALAEEYRDRVCAALANARLYERSQAALRARDDFLRIASHELRTPLTALRVSCERIAAETAPGLATSAERALRASRRLSRLVTHMLDAVQACHQVPTIQRAHDDLVPVVRDAVEDLLQTTPKARVELALPPSLWGQWDDDRVQEIVVNLVDNALRWGASPVAVELARAGSDAVLTVEDHGSGLPAEVRAHLFVPYAHGGGNGQGGLGLGLHLVKQLVDAHGGRIDVDSEDGGTRFVVRLPGAE